MDVRVEHLRFVESQLKSFPPTHRVAFAASCCERLLPNYNAFSRMENWGRPEILRRSLNEVWDSLERGISLSTDRIDALKQQCDQIIPDTEDFSSTYTSAALDAGTAVLATLECCRNGDPKHALDAASFCIDTVDMYIQDRDSLDYSDVEFEHKIYTDPLMVRELEGQRKDLLELAHSESLNSDLLRKLRSNPEYQGKSNINVG